MEDVRRVTHYDVQYTLQSEEVDAESEIYKLRYERNLEIARLAMELLQKSTAGCGHHPNGTIHEQGVVYRLARTWAFAR